MTRQETHRLLFLDLEVLGHNLKSCHTNREPLITRRISKVVLYYSWLVKEFYYLPAHEREGQERD